MRVLFLLTGISILLACDRKSGGGDRPFDRKAMLENYANQIILPTFSELNQKTTVLQSACLDLVKNKQLADLQTARSRWVDVLFAWQRANAFNFGPAAAANGQLTLLEEIASFPTDTAKINAYISAFDTSIANNDPNARGLFALEFLLFAGSDALVLSHLNQPAFATYLTNAANHLDLKIDFVLSQWNVGYKMQFIDLDGPDPGGSTAILYNEFIKSFETIKNEKLGRPLGKRIGQTGVEPQTVEAYYSGKSLQAMQLHFEALTDLWYGRGDEDGSGLRDYLQSAEGGAALIEKTEKQIAEIQLQFDALPAIPLSTQISNNPTSLEPLFQALSKHTRYWKSDMSSILGIYITYSSGDGD